MNNSSNLPSFATPEVAIFILLSFLVISLFFGKKSSITNETSHIRDSQITHIALPPTNTADDRVTTDVPTEMATLYMHPSDSTLSRFFGVEFSMVLWTFAGFVVWVALYRTHHLAGHDVFTRVCTAFGRKVSIAGVSFVLLWPPIALVTNVCGVVYRSFLSRSKDIYDYLKSVNTFFADAEAGPWVSETSESNHELPHSESTSSGGALEATTPVFEK